MNLGTVALTPNLVLFGGIGLLVALCGIGVVALNNPVRSALCLVVTFFLLAFLYFTLEAETLGITQIVVYTGAIMVLFLFVIMLLNLRVAIVLAERLDPKKAFAGLFGLALFAIIGVQILPGLLSISEPRALPGYGSPPVIGRALFTDYVYPFEAVSILLLIGIVGSILLAKRRI
jgi:NADH-quinone oxidoreductase subunit J